MSQSTHRCLVARLLFVPAFVTSLLMGCGGGSSPASGSASPAPVANPGSVVVYVDGNTRTSNTAPLAVGSLLRFSGLVFNDNGTLRMDCSEVSDGVAL